MKAVVRGLAFLLFLGIPNGGVAQLGEQLELIAGPFPSKKFNIVLIVFGPVAQWECTRAAYMPLIPGR